MSKIPFAIRELIILHASKLATERAALTGNSPENVGRMVSRIMEGGLQEDIRASKLWVDDAIRAVRACPEIPETKTDEEIAQLILDKYRESHPEDPRVVLGIAKELRFKETQG